MLIIFMFWGAGKTHTMTGELSSATSKERGLIPRLLTDLFANIIPAHVGTSTASASASSAPGGGSSAGSVTVEVSLLEVYQEVVYDLLAKPLQTEGAFGWVQCTGRCLPILCTR
jgi:hypothetical protein